MEARKIAATRCSKRRPLTVDRGDVRCRPAYSLPRLARPMPPRPAGRRSGWGKIIERLALYLHAEIPRH